MHRENFSYLEVQPAVDIVGLFGSSLTGKDIDTRGYDSLTFAIGLALASTATDPTTSYYYVRVEHTDASALGAGPSDYAVCLSIELIREGLSTAVTSGIVPINASTFSGDIMKIAYRGNKRYARIKLSTTGAMASSVSGVLYAVAVLGHAAHWPVTTSNLDNDE